MTFENPIYKQSSEDEMVVKDELQARGIYWYPVRYRRGSSVVNKFFESFDGIATGIKAVRRHRPRFVHARSSLPIATALALSKLFKLKYLYDADSILSEEYLEIGHWSADGFSYKTTARLENAARRRADEIVVLTKTLRKDFIDDYRVKAPIEVIPCCIDTDKFKPNGEARRARRGELGVGDEKLLVYVGKFGKRYLVDETFAFFKAFNRKHPASRLLIVSRDDRETFAQIAAASGVSEDLYFVRSGTPDEVAEWLAAADAGLCLIRQMKSERGSSPIKFSEYLAAGLPVVITDSIGDCSLLTMNENVGVVLPSLDPKGYDYAVENLTRLCGEDKKKLAERCRKTAESNFSIKTVGAARYREIYKRLLNDQGAI